jgi:zinc finger protein
MQLNKSNCQLVIQTIDPVQAEKVGEFINKLKTFRNGDASFTFVLDDISGNSFLENPCAPNRDEAMTITKYDRTTEDNEALGFEATEGIVIKKIIRFVI